MLAQSVIARIRILVSGKLCTILGSPYWVPEIEDPVLNLRGPIGLSQWNTARSSQNGFPQFGYRFLADKP